MYYLWSTYLFKSEMLSLTVGIILVSSSTIKIPVKRIPKGKPMAASSFCWYTSPTNKIQQFCYTVVIKLCMPFSFRRYILSKATLITSSRDTLKNKDPTSNDIKLNPLGTFALFIFSIKSFVLLNVNWEWLKGDKSFTKYFCELVSYSSYIRNDWSNK